MTHVADNRYTQHLPGAAAQEAPVVPAPRQGRRRRRSDDGGHRSAP